MKIFYSNITGVHGLKGEVESAFSDKSYFSSLPVLNQNTLIYIDNQIYTIINVKKKNKAFVFQLKDINNIDLASSLVGKDIYIDSDTLPILDDNTFYEAELIGYEIIDSDNNIYGKVEDIYSLPSNYVLIISLNNNNKKTVSIPFVNAYFGKADKLKKTIEIIQKPILDED